MVFKTYKIKIATILFFCIIFFNAQSQNTKTFSDTVDILHYDIHLNILEMGAKSIDGFATLVLTSRLDSVNQIILDFLALDVDSVVKDTQMLTYEQEGEKLIINLGAGININDTVTIDIFYQGHPLVDASGWGGFYFGSDSLSAFNLGVGFEAVPHNYGRVWYPCIDDFVDRATYDFYIRVESLSKAVCGGVLKSEVDNGDGTKTFHWQLTDPIPTYLSSVAVGRYALVADVYHGIEKDIPIEIYVRPQDSTKVQATFAHLKDALSFFEARFGPYKWQRVGYVGVSFNSGAMEHASNIAYPSSVINGTTTYDDLMAHELSHHWFGNLATCSTAEDMWINEGWASFCEFIFFEGMYGDGYARDVIRSIHKQVLQMAHVVDGNYWALYGIPQELTYCRTVYDKGSIVANNMRAYLGDSIFFEAITAFLDSFSFKEVSSYQFRDFLSSYTQKDMGDFFDNWVFTGGFPHFSVDSFLVDNQGGNYLTEVFIKQKLNGRQNFTNNNIVEITFTDENWNFYTDTMKISGQYGEKVFSVPFLASEVFVNFNEKSCFASTSNIKNIQTTGNITFPEAHFISNVTQITDSVLLRVAHHWVAPDSLKSNNPAIVRLSPYRYWSVEGINFNKLKATGRFHYNRSTPMSGSLASNGWLDNTLFSVSADSLLLLHRINTSDDWKIVPFTRMGNHVSGYINVDTLKEGEYVLAIGTPFNNSLNENVKKSMDMLIYPNPSDNEFLIQFTEKTGGILQVTDLKGKLIDKIAVEGGTAQMTWRPENLSSGLYLFVFRTENEQLTRKVMFEK